MCWFDRFDVNRRIKLHTKIASKQIAKWQLPTFQHCHPLSMCSAWHKRLIRSANSIESNSFDIKTCFEKLHIDRLSDRSHTMINWYVNFSLNTHMGSIKFDIVIINRMMQKWQINAMTDWILCLSFLFFKKVQFLSHTIWNIFHWIVMSHYSMQSVMINFIHTCTMNCEKRIQNKYKHKAMRYGSTIVNERMPIVLCWRSKWSNCHFVFLNSITIFYWSNAIDVWCSNAWPKGIRVICCN